MKNNHLIGLSVLTALFVSGCAQKSVEVQHPRTLAYPQIKTQQPLPKSIQQAKLWQGTPQTALNQPQAKRGEVSIGTASWYGEKYHGRTTAYGEKFDMMANTAAHKTLPHNTLVKVTDMVSGKSAVLRINDRGPNVPERILDVSKGAAQRLGFLNQGTTDVRIEVVGHAQGKQVAQTNFVQGEGCIGGDCQSKELPARKPIYSGVSNAFNKPFKRGSSSESLTETIPQNRIITEEEQYMKATQQNHVQYDYSGSPFIRDHVDDSTFAQQKIPAYGYPYSEERIQKMIAPSGQIAIQVGAFRRYAGARVYANRYNLLDANHKAKIKKYIEDAQTLYKVQIEGFSSDEEAKAFIRRHNLKRQGAFLVRR